MKRMCNTGGMLIILSVFLLFGCQPSSENQTDSERKTYVIAWSHYTAWEVFQYLDQSDILRKWEDKYDVDVDFRLINDYAESIALYTAGNFEGILVTNLEALSIPGVGGVDSKAIVVTSSSNGNDGLVAKGISNIEELRGQSVLLVQYSVSHYLLSRALTENGMTLDDVELSNANESDIDAVYMNSEPPAAISTWNPILIRIKDSPGANLLFDSSRLPGEIVELLFVRPEVPDEVNMAIVGAWHDAMALLHGPDSEQKTEMLAILAESSGGTLDEYMRQFETTRFFPTAEEAADFLEDSAYMESMDKVRTFTFDAGLYGEGASSKDIVGMRFPGGGVLGDENRVVLEFDSSYLRRLSEEQ